MTIVSIASIKKLGFVRAYYIVIFYCCEFFSSLVFKYPLKIEEQKRIVNEINNLSEQTKQLEKHYKQKLKNLEELKKSILQKAFSGELLNDS